MGYYYKFYRPRDMKIIEEGKFSGMPFYWNKLPCEIPMFIGSNDLNGIYDVTGLINRNIADKLQSVMTTNKTMFTDMMNENSTDVLVFRIE